MKKWGRRRIIRKLYAMYPENLREKKKENILEVHKEGRHVITLGKRTPSGRQLRRGKQQCPGGVILVGNMISGADCTTTLSPRCSP